MTMTDLQPVHEPYAGLFNSASRIKIDLNNPRPEMFNIQDIAKGLSNTCRFGGQIHTFYSVAQHSCIVAALAPDHLKRIALLHDASEAFLGDVIKPLKIILGTSYETIEDNFDKVILSKFNCDIEMLPLIKQYDKIALEVEHAFFHNISPIRLEELIQKHFKYSSTIWTPVGAEKMFLQLYHNYFIK